MNKFIEELGKIECTDTLLKNQNLKITFYKQVLQDEFNSRLINDYINLLEPYRNKKIERGEIHHILPKSLYPLYEHNESNMVYLPYEIHYEAHELLVEITKHKTNKMIQAFQFMNNYTDGYYTKEKYREVKMRYEDEGRFTPKKLYWCNGKRVEDKSLSTGRKTGFEKGLAALNDKNTQCYINLITKKYVRESKLNNDHHLVKFSAYKISGIYVLLFDGMYFVGRNNILSILFDRFVGMTKQENVDYFKNSKITTVKKKLSNLEAKYVETIKGIQFKDLGCEVINILDYKYDESHVIIHSQEELHQLLEEKIKQRGNI